MPQSRRSLHEGGPAPAGLEFAAALLPSWGFPPGTGIAPAGEQGTNNRSFLVRHRQQRYVMRVSGFLSVAEVRAELIGTAAGPAAVCRWLPGVRPVMHGETAFERFGRAAGLLTT
jgi:homoserine kinase type II